jgi:predicted nuclease of predicted toxin-antitoxin system
VGGFIFERGAWAQAGFARHGASGVLLALNILLDEHIWPGVVSTIRAMLPQLQVESLHHFSGGRLMNCDDGIILRECRREKWILVTFDVNTIPAILSEIAVNQEEHAGMIFISSKSFAQNDYPSLARALVELARSELDADWTNRVVFLSKC